MFLKCLCFGGSKKEKTVIEELCHHFSFEALRKATNGFDEKLQIGGGRYNKLYKGCLKHDNGDATDYTIALKVMRIQEFLTCYGSYDPFKNEIEVLCQLRHPNIISLIGFCYQEKRCIIVYEYMANGSLRDYLSNRDKEPLSWKKRLDICIGVAHGLHYLHAGAKRCIIHSNINPRNILLDRNMVPKISGFELVLKGELYTSKKPNEFQIECLHGTFGYLAPEQYQQLVTDKSDVFSFGVFLKFVISPDFPVLEYGDAYTLEEMIDPNLNGKIAPECWQVFTSVIQSCLQDAEYKRPTMGEVEILLENALSLQEQADLTNTNAAHYTLLSTTYLSDLFSSWRRAPRI